MAIRRRGSFDTLLEQSGIDRSTRQGCRRPDNIWGGRGKLDVAALDRLEVARITITVAATGLHRLVALPK